MAAAALVLFVEDGSAAVSMDVEVEVEGGSGFVDIVFMKIWF